MNIQPHILVIQLFGKSKVSPTYVFIPRLIYSILQLFDNPFMEHIYHDLLYIQFSLYFRANKQVLTFTLSEFSKLQLLKICIATDHLGDFKFLQIKKISKFFISFKTSAFKMLHFHLAFREFWIFTNRKKSQNPLEFLKLQHLENFKFSKKKYSKLPHWNIQNFLLIGWLYNTREEL